MKRYILHIISFLAAFGVTQSAWGQTIIGATWAGGTLANNTTYKLNSSTKIVKLSGAISIPSGRTVTIDLNGCILQGGTFETMISVNGTLNIIDSSNRTYQHKGKLNGFGLWYPDANGTVILKGGTICPTYTNVSTQRSGILITGKCNIEYANLVGFYKTAVGPAVTATSSGKFTMKGGQISYNYCNTASTETRGGAVYGEPANSNNPDGSLIDISNTLLSNNKSEKLGGAICGYKVILNNTKVNYNESSTHGGAIALRGNKASLSISNNSEVCNNKSNGHGGGIYITDECTNLTINITNSKINYNQALATNSVGGGIAINTKNEESLISKCNITESEVNYNYSATYGGGVYSKVSTTITNSKINYNRSMTSATASAKGYGRGGGFLFTAGSVNELINTEVAYNAAMYYGGGGQIDNSAKLTLKDNSNIHHNIAVLHGAGGIHLTAQAHLVLESGQISNNQCYTVGGAIHTSYGCTMELNGGTIQGNFANQRGGGIHVNTGGDVLLNGTNIIGNEVKRGKDLAYAEVYVDDNGIRQWRNLEFNSNSTDLDSEGYYHNTGYGGGILIDSGTFTMNGGIISGNKAEVGGGALALVMIRLPDKKGEFNNLKVVQFNMNAGTIKENFTDGDGAGVYIMKNRLPEMQQDLSPEALAEIKEAENYNKLYNGKPIASIKTGSLNGNIAQGSGGAIYQQQGDIYIETDATLNFNEANNNGGAIYLGDGTITVNGNATLKSNKAISMNGGGIYLGGGSFTVSQNGELNLGGASQAEGNIAGGNGGGVFCGAPFTAKGTSMIQNNSAANGGGVYVNTGYSASFTKKTTLLNNSATANGGAIYVKGGNITLVENSMNSNTALNGGAIYLDGGDFTAVGSSTMSSNTASGNGGAVYVSGGNIEISGASSVLTLSSNNAVNGGAFYVNNGSITTSAIQKAIINNNYSAAVAGTGGEGGAFYVSNGNINMCKTDLSGNGKLGDNVKTTNGGAIALYNGVFSFADGSEIKNNAATGNGGGLYVSSATAKTIKCIGGSYQANSSALGGGIYASGPIDLTIAANVRGNAAVNGGGLYLTEGVNMTFGYEDAEKGVVDGLIVDNSATATGGSGGVGGGIYVDKGTLSFYLPADKAKQKLGIYNNVATFEAADIFSSGVSTTVKLPNVGGMNLTGFDVPGSTLYWVKDFNDNRYQTALMNLNADIETMILGFNADEPVKTLTDKQCLDLGYDLVYVTLKAVNLGANDNAALEISYPLDKENPNVNNIKQYRKILLQGNKDAIVGLPSGLWNMNLTEWAVTYDQPSLTPAAGTNGFVNITRQALKPTDGVITVTFKVKEQFEQKEVLRYDYIKVNKMVPRVAN